MDTPGSLLQRGAIDKARQALQMLRGAGAREAGGRGQGRLGQKRRQSRRPSSRPEPLPPSHCPQGNAPKPLPAKRCPQTTARKALPPNHCPQTAHAHHPPAPQGSCQTYGRSSRACCAPCRRERSVGLEGRALLLGPFVDGKPSRVLARRALRRALTLRPATKQNQPGRGAGPQPAVDAPGAPAAAEPHFDRVPGCVCLGNQPNVRRVHEAPHKHIGLLEFLCAVSWSLLCACNSHKQQHPKSPGCPQAAATPPPPRATF
jgi:hypothetical protein